MSITFPLGRLVVCATILSIGSFPGAAETPDLRAVANDNRTTGGRLEKGVRKIELEAHVAKWYPESDSGSFLEVQTFGEVGHAPSVPGPLIRVTEQTVIEATVTNRLPGAPLVVHGLHSRPGPDEPLAIPPGETRSVSFTAGKPGTYFYWATTTGSVIVRPPRPAGGRRGVRDCMPDGSDSQQRGWRRSAGRGARQDRARHHPLWGFHRGSDGNCS